MFNYNNYVIIFSQEKLVAIVKIASTICFRGNQDGFIKFTIIKKLKRDVFICEGLYNASAIKSTNKETVSSYSFMLPKLSLFVTLLLLFFIHIVDC